MQSDGVIGRYALGGAVGATLYIEPAATIDVDVFVSLQQPTSALVTLSPIYNYLLTRGCKTEGEHVLISGWPVQFLFPADALEQEAIEHARPTEVAGVKTWVMPAEHLVAIALKTGRAKDHARIVQFLEHDAVDRGRLNDVLARHQLKERWNEFERRFRKTQ